ncbi:molybdenum cofactor cytidylyltransferase [Sphingomonas sp. BE123]|uniref:nucleotidyltransferase family protein n=1 Tax=Sphingomonas sp. BE123 TaxID=2817842 RepID=UPI002863B034|nr:nucleotidyltransferase family protein [Sphingomonas sp. BE123]MDR6851559.1 molybdenum cofactor cytidylyltransferase [Sphingomonas sp. BE123]
MIRAERAALVLLAAGRSRRFGDADKLTMPWRGRPLGLHAVAALAAVPFAARIAVVADTALDLAGHGYRIVTNDDPAAGMGRSLRLGVAAAMHGDPDAVIVALADMPRITATQIHRLLDHADGDTALVASSDGVTPCPPALFGRGHFAALRAAAGDRGARDLIRRGHHVVAPSAELVDIDTPEDLDRLIHG